MDVSNNASATQKPFVIKNTGAIFICWLFILASLYGVYWLYQNDNNDTPWLFYAIPISLGLISRLRLNAIKDGIVIDVEKNKFEFYGGAMAANDFSDYFSPSWLLQFFKRYSWKLDSITSCRKDFKTTVSDKGHVSTTYYVCITSTNGNVSIPLSEGKVDEALAILVSVCNMGSPILNR